MVTITGDGSFEPRSVNRVASRHPHLVTRTSSPVPRHREHARQAARGYIDNSVTFWILLILAIIGGWQWLEYAGIAPAGLWDRVPGTWKALLAATGMLIIAGAIALFVADRAEERREPYRVETQNGRCVISEAAIVERTLGAVLLACGLIWIGFGIAGTGWFSWIVLGLGAFLALIAVPVAFGGRRYVVERGRLASERGTLGSWSQAEACAWEGNAPPALELKSTSSGGAFGQSYVEHHAIRVGDKEIISSPSRDRAEKLLALLRRALDDTRA